MKRAVTYILIFLSLVSCDDESKLEQSETKIEIGVFTFQFPIGFKLYTEKGIDSFVGKITNGKIDFQYDYGNYSNSLDKTITEYLEQDIWKWNALGLYGLLPSGTDLSAINKEISLISSQTEDSIKYINLYKYKEDTLSYELIIPKTIIDTKFEIDTIDNFLYKYIRKRNYVGLYVKKLNGIHKTNNSFEALSIDASYLNNKETEIAYKILHSCKLQK